MTADQLGRYGRQALKHMQEHNQELYKELQESGKLMDHLHQVEEDIFDMIELVESRLLKNDPIPDPMDTYKTYQHKLMIRAQAEEIALCDLIYNTKNNRESDLKSLAAMRKMILENKEKYKNGQWDQMDDDLSILAVKRAMEKKATKKR